MEHQTPHQALPDNQQSSWLPFADLQQNLPFPPQPNPQSFQLNAGNQVQQPVTDGFVIHPNIPQNAYPSYPNYPNHPTYQQQYQEQYQQVQIPMSQQMGFPTPQGMQQVVSSQQEYADVKMRAEGRNQSSKSGLRWEAIVPAMAAVLFVVTGVLVITNFDTITGKNATEKAVIAPASVPTETSAPASTNEVSVAATTDPADENVSEGNVEATPTKSTEKPSVVLKRAADLVDLGRYDEAKVALKELTDAGQSGPAVMRVQAKLDKNIKLNDALMGKLAVQRADAKWADVIKTIDQIKSLHPLSKQLESLRVSANKHIVGGGGANKAAAPILNKVEVKPVKVAKPAKVASAPLAAPAAASAANATVKAPPAQSSVSGGGSVEVPARPNIPNPSSPSVGGVTGGQPAVVSAETGAANCHTHDGITECH